MYWTILLLLNVIPFSLLYTYIYTGMAEFNTLCVEKIKNKALGWAPQRNVDAIISWLQVQNTHIFFLYYFLGNQTRKRH